MSAPARRLSALSFRAAAPRAIASLPRRQGTALLSLFFIPATAQAILLTVVPLEALKLLGTAQAVTVVYVAAGLIAVAGRFSIPFLVSLIRRRFVFTLGAISLAASSSLMAVDRVPTLVVGIALSTFAFACLEITSQLYLLDHVSRDALRRFEPMRIFVSAGPWTLGPWLGVYLQQKVSFAAPFAIAGAAAVGVVCLVWWLRLSENTMLTAARHAPLNPLRYLPRFFAQPRLRLAWVLSAARSSWWNMFFVYVPIFAVTSDLGADAGGALVSIGTGWMWMVPLWGWAGRRYGLRRLLQWGYAAGGVLSIAAASAFGVPWVGAVLLAAAAFGVEMLDGAGNLLFFRAVHPYERAEMTTVFASYRDMAQFGPPAVCSVLLSVLTLPWVFVGGGVMMLASSVLSRHVPRRL